MLPENNHGTLFYSYSSQFTEKSEVPGMSSTAASIDQSISRGQLSSWKLLQRESSAAAASCTIQHIIPLLKIFPLKIETLRLCDDVTVRSKKETCGDEFLILQEYDVRIELCPTLLSHLSLNGPHSCIHMSSISGHWQSLVGAHIWSQSSFLLKFAPAISVIHPFQTLMKPIKAKYISNDYSPSCK